MQKPYVSNEKKEETTIIVISSFPFVARTGDDPVTSPMHRDALTNRATYLVLNE